MITIENLTKKFGNTLAVNNVTMNINDSEVFGFLGPNGAGKTTIVRMLCCLISKTSGQATIGEYEIGNRNDQQKIRRQIGLLPENVGLYEELSAYKNLDFFGRYYNRSVSQRKERIEYFLKEFGLWEKRNNPAGSFSKGMKQKLAIARALIHDPQIIFFDEPTANLDPETSKIVIDYILELKKEKKTIILNTHMLDEAERICDTVCILKTEVKKMASPKNLRESMPGKKTIIQIANINESIISAIRKAGFEKIEILKDQIVVHVTDPYQENPILVDAIHSSGGKLQSMTIQTATLEDVYLNLVRS